MPAIHIAPDLYDELTELKFDIRVRSINEVLRWLLAKAGIEPYNEMFEFDED